jgi:hypothetical protein
MMDVDQQCWRNNFHYFITGQIMHPLKMPHQLILAGGHLIQNVTSIDLSKYFTDVASGFNLNGVEYRTENFEIFAGKWFYAVR